MFKNWNNRDWIWTVSILVIVIILIISKHFVIIDNNNILNYISFAATGISVALALVAMGISISQNESSQQLNNQMSNTIERMDEKLNGMKDNIDKINKMKSYSKAIDEKIDTISSEYGISSFHQIIITINSWDSKEFIVQLKKQLKSINQCSLIDYDIMPIKNYRDNFFKYATSMVLTFNQSLEYDDIERIISHSFDNIGITTKGTQSYFNNKI